MGSRDTGDRLNVLMVDDTSSLARSLLPLLQDLRDELDRDVKLTHRASAREAVALVNDDGYQPDIALIDLDLRVEQPTGLLAMHALSALPAPPAIVVWTEPYDAERILCLLAAGAWFNVEAVHDKITGLSMDDDSRRFVGMMKAVLGGQPGFLPQMMLSRRLRDTLDKITTMPEFSYWCAFATEIHMEVVAETIHASRATMGRWTDRSNPEGPVCTIDGLWAAVAAATEQDPRSASRDAFLADIRRQRGTAKPVPAPSLAHQFAKSQRLFLQDPYVHERLTGRPRAGQPSLLSVD